jgi:hypothetical protein
MRTQRLAVFALIALGTLAMAGCYGGNATANTVAPVMLSEEITQGPADVDVSVLADVTIENMTITSTPKSPSADMSQQQDVTLTEWVITPSRTDGGTVASPQWTNYYSVYVPAGGSTTVNNYRIFPADYFLQSPLYQLFPANGGYDKETGKPNIRQRLHIEVFGKTNAGRAVSLAFDVNLNFFYLGS